MTEAIRLFTSNRLELLAERLASVVRTPLADPLEQEMIVVQSRGMERWLAMQLSGRLGVWANCRYPFPNALAWEMFRLVLPALPEENPYAPEAMSWRLMAVIPACLEQDGFAPLKGYLAEDRRGIKLFQLAGAVADLFDQYTLFRPEMIKGWEQGRSCDDCCWQAELWRRISPEGKGVHRGALLEDFRKAMRRKAPLPAQLPARISVFGIPSLPPYHLEILAALSRRIEVNLFLLNPSSRHWFQIVSPLEKVRKICKNPDQPGLFDLLEVGNPLLASQGGQGRDFFEMLYEEFPLDDSNGGLFRKPEASGMLAAIQRDILDLADATSGQRPLQVIADSDCSLQLHSCHSPLREVEVLHDRLLDLFEAMPGLTPRDVIVMTPQIDEYAPFIAAVFGGVKDPERRIPFSVADRTMAVAGSLARTFVDLLASAESRFEASRIMDLLENRFVARRFGLDDDGLAACRRWITGCGIRWGIDAADRAEEGLPAFGANSWSDGLDRLLLGYAMSGDNAALFKGLLPYPDIEGGEARSLGGVVVFCEALFELRRLRNKERTTAEWASYLSGLLERLFLPDDEAQAEYLYLVSSFDELRRRGEATGFSGVVSLAVIRSWLTGRLARAGAAEGFLTGRVTFCAMLPMRSIPFRVVALLGMNDGVFPRQHRPSGFDLMAAAPKRCDRSIRNEDRYLFLESLLSARDALYISYVGQSGRDNSLLPPSVVVSELLDYAERAFTLPGVPENRRRSAVRERIAVRHRLQPFHRDYFNSGLDRLFSYSVENCAAAGSRQTGGGTSVVHSGLPLLPPDSAGHCLTIEQLAAFLRNPADCFLKRAGIRIEPVAPPMEDREPFAIAGLDAYRITTELVADLLAGSDPASKAEIFGACGMLPPAAVGRVGYAALKGKAERFASLLAPYASVPALEPLEIDLTISGCRLTGRLTGITADNLLRYRCARLKAKDLLNCWLHHLLLNLVAPEGYPCRSRLIALDCRQEFVPCHDAGPILSALVGLYLKGLGEPIPFFPETSYEFAVNPDRVDKLLPIWNGYESGKTRHPGECESSSAFELFFGPQQPEELFSSAAFRETAQAVYLPLLACIRKEGE
ncbi:recBCD enzyme subunit RecC [Geobacter sp. OR-1]|uniref:exodeoxyribonuclease V subunit gamma n=1 Tax=Geobacter sp. OR-1 TaxID=1266765 RepID=UPI0005444506|nr:exodeoxyribonuclease V subunit gamma [Geobacter sp. OR-1]GAM07774.1 recBCD enzyme subunit RecC [Geobacter sp. OR-1]